MTLCIFEACRYSRLVEGQERIWVRRGRGWRGLGTTRKAVGEGKKIKSLRDKEEGVGREIRKSGRTDKQA